MNTGIKFSPINFWIVLLLLLPNILFALFPPIDNTADETRPKAWNIILLLERLGQIGVFTLPMLFAFKVDTLLKKYALAAMIIFILLYYICWTRYFMGGRQFSLLYKNLFFIPIPMAVFPVLYCLSASIIFNAWIYTSSAISLAIGHIPESLYAAKFIQ